MHYSWYLLCDFSKTVMKIHSVYMYTPPYTAQHFSFKKVFSDSGKEISHSPLQPIPAEPLML